MHILSQIFSSWKEDQFNRVNRISVFNITYLGRKEYKEIQHYEKKNKQKSCKNIALRTDIMFGEYLYSYKYVKSICLKIISSHPGALI